MGLSGDRADAAMDRRQPRQGQQEAMEALHIELVVPWLGRATRVGASRDERQKYTVCLGAYDEN